MVNIEAAGGATCYPPAVLRGGSPAGAGGGFGLGRGEGGSALPARDRGRVGGDGHGGGFRCLTPEVGRSTWLSFNTKWQTVVKALAN